MLPRVVLLLCGFLVSELSAQQSSDAAVRLDHPSAVRTPGLAVQLEPLLAPGETVALAATGFKSQRRFVMALHLARNLNIPFCNLKSAITKNSLSLEAAIQKLRPDLDGNTVRENVRLAKRQMANDFDRAVAASKRSERATSRLANEAR